MLYPQRTAECPGKGKKINNDIQQYSEVNTDGTIKILTYDDAGNPDQMGDWALTWDGEDRLKSMTNSITGEKLEFEYDFRGFRIWKKVFAAGDYVNPLKWIGYIYDGNLVTEEIDLNDNNKKIIRSYTWGLDPAGTQQQVGGIGALVSMEERQPDDSYKTFHVVSDAGGNVTNLIQSHDDGSLTMANTYEYGPSGQVIAKTENVDMPYQFNTKYTDEETDLVYYGYRFYDAGDGRWLNRDPLSTDGGLNVYNSVSNNMVNGFSGGLSFTGGMKFNVGRMGTALKVDSWGLTDVDVDLSDLQRGNSVHVRFGARGDTVAIEMFKDGDEIKWRAVKKGGHAFDKKIAKQAEKAFQELLDSKEGRERIKKAIASSFDKPIHQSPHAEPKVRSIGKQFKALRKQVTDLLKKGGGCAISLSFSVYTVATAKNKTQATINIVQEGVTETVKAATIGKVVIGTSLVKGTGTGLVASTGVGGLVLVSFSAGYTAGTKIADIRIGRHPISGHIANIIYNLDPGLFAIGLGSEPKNIRGRIRYEPIELVDGTRFIPNPVTGRIMMVEEPITLVD